MDGFLVNLLIIGLLVVGEVEIKRTFLNILSQVHLLPTFMLFYLYSLITT